MDIQISGKVPIQRVKYSDKCKGCQKSTIYQKNCRGLSTVVRPFEDYHWICRVCVKCNRGAIVRDNKLIYVDVYGIHKPELGGCNSGAREFTREEIDKWFYYMPNYYEKEPESIFD